MPTPFLGQLLTNQNVFNCAQAAFLCFSLWYHSSAGLIGDGLLRSNEDDSATHEGSMKAPSSVSKPNSAGPNFSARPPGSAGCNSEFAAARARHYNDMIGTGGGTIEIDWYANATGDSNRAAVACRPLYSTVYSDTAERQTPCS
jgi:hypothetical protein